MLRRINEQYQVKIAKRFTALENFGDKADTSRARETAREYLNFIQREPRSL
jgi:hypothetical protein